MANPDVPDKYKLAAPPRTGLRSDYPFPLGEAHPGKLIESMKQLSAKEKAQLLAGTAREFLGMNSSHKGHGGHKK